MIQKAVEKDDKNSMQRIVALLNHNLELIHLTGNERVPIENLLGQECWECLSADSGSTARAAVGRCLEFGSSEFVRLQLVGQAAAFPGQMLYAWFDRVAGPLVFAEILAVPRKYDTLTRRERSVLLLLAEGVTPKRIALLLGLADSTIHTHLKHIRDKLELRDLIHVGAWASRHYDILGSEQVC